MFLPKKKTSRTRIFTPETLEKITSLHIQGYRKSEICEELSIKVNSFEKALSQNRIVLPVLPSTPNHRAISTKSSRAVFDNNFGMGKSCSNVLERVLASRIGSSATTTFDNHIDLSHGGLLLALPALLACGLLRYVSRFDSVTGYYTPTHVLLSLAFLVLLRINRLEQSDRVCSGELGRCMGLDRIPEVKVLRKRIARFCEASDVDEWASQLSNDWMKGDDQLEGVLYIDGHVNLYYGDQVEMPKRFVSRMRLCMSGSTDYWVNNQIGQPFFVISKTINDGLIKAITEDIIPRLNRDVPNQPTESELKENEQLHRYMIVFDREGYSIDFFEELAHQRIAFCTYKKNVKEDWDDSEFSDYEIITPNGDKENVLLAERETVLSGPKEKGKPEKKITVREIRKKSASGHQTSVITTNYVLSIVQICIYMFSRWCQEIFFKYMIESFDIDSITSYMKSSIPGTSLVINPQYKELDRQHKKILSLLNANKKKFAEITLQDKELSEKQMEQFMNKKSDKKNEIDDLEKQKEAIIQLKKNTQKKILFSDLNEDQQFDTSVNERKFFLDIIKIIAFRAETSMCNIIKILMSSPEQARSLMRKLYSADADIETDNVNNNLTVKIHNTNHWIDDKILQNLCDNLNETQTVFPGTNLIIQYKLVTALIP